MNYAPVSESANNSVSPVEFNVDTRFHTEDVDILFCGGDRRKKGGYIPRYPIVARAFQGIYAQMLADNPFAESMLIEFELRLVCWSTESFGSSPDRKVLNQLSFSKGWPGCVKSAVVHVISLAHYAIVYARAWPPTASTPACDSHPSGVAEPSHADEAITRRLKAALTLVDVRVLDHFVVSAGECVSFSERGLL